MNNRYEVLVVEDEENINNLVTTLLEANGYATVSAYNGDSAKMLYSSHRPDLIILDLGLPDMDGITLLRDIRRDSFVPIIVLSARTHEGDKVCALDLGANDYVTKPFGSAELMARVRSALRVNKQSGSTVPDGKFVNGGLVIEYATRRVLIDGKDIKLTKMEYNIIALLAEHAGKVLTYSFIIKNIWGYDGYGSVKRLQVNMANIRKKFGAKPGKDNYISNELGVGYSMTLATE